jgi:TonB-linked SusC/RagA family outer membrane protein
MSKLKSTLLGLLAITSVPLAAVAQGRGVVAGIVRAQDGAPLPGARVTITGTNLRAQTGQDGTYRIVAVPAGSHDVSAIMLGYSPQSQRIVVADAQTVTANFSLQQTALQIGGVVVTATGREQETREIGSSVGVVNTDQVPLATTSSASDLLAGRVSGVVVTQSSGTTGGGARVRIRGSNSMSLSNAPLIVVDGIRVENSEQSLTFGVGGQAPSRFNDINPNDIESIEVLKGPAAAALYGTAAANGVIQVTTKRGSAGHPDFRVYAEQGRLDQIAKFPDNVLAVGNLVRNTGGVVAPLASPGRCDILRQAIGSTPAPGQTGCTGITTTYTFNPLEAGGDAIYKIGNRQAVGGSVSGGTTGSTFYLGTDYSNEHGVQPMNTQQRIRVQANTTGRLGELMTVGANISYLDSRGEFPQSDNALYGLVGMGLSGSASPDAVAATKGFADDPALFYDWKTYQNYTRLTGAVRGEFRPLSWLSFNGTAGVDRYAREDRQRIPRTSAYSVFGPPYEFGFIQSNTSDIYDLTTNLSGTAIRDLRPDLVSTTSLGTQYIRERNHQIYAFGAGLTPGIETSLAGATSDFSAGETNSPNATLAAYLQQQFAWRDRVFLNAALRADKNTAFGQDIGWISYPSVSGSWVVSDESFFPKFDALSSLRLRAAYGQAGLRPGPTAAIQSFSANVTTRDASDVAAITFGSIGNPNLKPERTTEMELGFESQFFQDRLGLEMTYYNKDSHDALVSKPLPPSAGSAGSRFENVGSVNNRGLEYMLSGTPVRGNSVEWNASLSGSFLRNRLTDLGVDAQGKPNAPIIVTSTQRHVEGYALGSYFHFPIVSYSDADGNGLLSANEVTVGDTVEYLGNPFPTREASFTSDITFGKVVKLSGLIDYKGGMKLLNMTRAWRESSVDFANGAALYDPNTPLDRQAAIVARSVYRSYAGYAEDASFVKLREVALTFMVPNRYLSRVAAQGLSITLAGRNLHTWTKYTGLDPELNYAGQSNFTTADFTTVPPNRLFQIRVDANF